MRACAAERLYDATVESANCIRFGATISPGPTEREPSAGMTDEPGTVGAGRHRAAVAWRKCRFDSNISMKSRFALPCADRPDDIRATVDANCFGVDGAGLGRVLGGTGTGCSTCRGETKTEVQRSGFQRLQG